MNQKSRIWAVTAGIVLLFGCSSPQNEGPDAGPAQWVDPMIGTDYFGHTYPGPALPFGMVHLSPDQHTEGWTFSSGYSYSENTIMGFSHTHFSGTGMVSGGDVLLMPVVGDEIQVVPGTREDPDSGYRSRFSHADEQASPGYYSVVLSDYNVRAELTATQRTGMHRYTFPKAGKANILIDLGHKLGGSSPQDSAHLWIVSDRVVEGEKSNDGVKVYFRAEFSQPFQYYGTWDADYRTPESGESLFPYKNEERGVRIGGFFGYQPDEDEQVIVKVGISYVDMEGARKNLTKENPGWDFDAVVAQAREAWNSWLDKFEVSVYDPKHVEIFFTAVYHSLLAQYISQDVDGRYMGMDGAVHAADGFDFYPSFSCWDTYRTEHPLMTLVAPDRVNDMVKSIVAKTKHYGWLPAQHFRNVFGQGMVGDHLVPVITDAYVKGHRDYDVEFIYRAMRTKALSMPPSPLPASGGRSGLEYYMDLGYAPCDKVTESVPNTMELAYNDWCIAQMAQALGYEEDYVLFMKRAGYYRNVYDRNSGFMRPRKADGTWLEAIDGREQEVVRTGDHVYYKYFDPLLVGRRPARHYTESNAWQYIWSVQHDAQGLVQLIGGPEPFVHRLDTFFNMQAVISPPKYVGVVGTIGQYVQGNQPSHHVAYLYNYAGQPWKTQERARQVTSSLYRTGPGGLCGNEDMGSLSSWYVFSAMGFYPVTPGSTSYAIGSPLLQKAAVQVGAGRVFTMTAENNSEKNMYIQEATLNGEPLNRSWIDHAEIMNGGTLHFVMGPEPNRQWAAQTDAAPYSMSTAK
jgi:predicted alpha-1,2-mannosidase